MKKLLVFLVAAGIFVLPSAAEAKGKTFLVGEQVVKWQTPEKFRRGVRMAVRFKYRGRNLSGVMLRKDCALEYSGYGLIVRIRACDNGSKPSPLRLRIASAREDVVKLRMVYWRQR